MPLALDNNHNSFQRIRAVRLEQLLGCKIFKIFATIFASVSNLHIVMGANFIAIVSKVEAYRLQCSLVLKIYKVLRSHIFIIRIEFKCNIYVYSYLDLYLPTILLVDVFFINSATSVLFAIKCNFVNLRKNIISCSSKFYLTKQDEFM